MVWPGSTRVEGRRGREIGDGLIGYEIYREGKTKPYGQPSQ